MNYSDGDKILVMAGKTPLTYIRKGNSWHLMNLTDFLVTNLIDSGKAELL